MARDTIVLTVSLKIPDNEARSALEALRVKMGFADRVKDIVREEVWELFVESAAAVAPNGAGAFDSQLTDSLESLKRIVETTNLFANPNKHRYEIRVGRAADVELDVDEAAILVSDREGARGVSMSAAVRRLGADLVSGARRWTRWRVKLAEVPAHGSEEVFDLLRGIGVADARDGGLLCNPHIQDAVAVLPWGEEKRLVS